jgi:hypothetical protein
MGRTEQLLAGDHTAFAEIPGRSPEDRDRRDTRALLGREQPVHRRIATCTTDPDRRRLVRAVERLVDVSASLDPTR